jgi:hypothetical protein
VAAGELQLAGLVTQGLLAEDEALALAFELAYGLAQRAYNVPTGGAVQP